MKWICNILEWDKMGWAKLNGEQKKIWRLEQEWVVIAWDEVVWDEVVWDDVG